MIALLFSLAMADVRIEKTQDIHVVCKRVSYSDGCNSCSHTLCTNGTAQWVHGGESCTLAFCPEVEPFNSNDWTLPIDWKESI